VRMESMSFMTDSLAGLALTCYLPVDMQGH
jgi:hypothetical protein